VIFLVLNIFLRALIVYFTVLFVMRLMGKREIGQLSTFDLVVAIMIAEISVFPLNDLKTPLYIGLIPMFTLVGAQIVISYLCLHSSFVRGLVDGYPSVIIANGKIMDREMRKQRYNINDLLGQLREKNVFNIADVEYAILETSGELSVIVKSSRRPLVPEDLNIRPHSERIPVPLILDGVLLQNNMEYLGLSESWIENKISELGLTKKDILYASLDCQGKLYLSEKEKCRTIQQLF
jgi:uncharacterized membrane protein YcaP (DUF421 family)